MRLTVASDSVTAEHGIFISFLFNFFLWWSPLKLFSHSIYTHKTYALAVLKLFLMIFSSNKFFHSQKFLFSLSFTLIYFFFLLIFSIINGYMFRSRDNMKISTSSQVWEEEVPITFFCVCLPQCARYMIERWWWRVNVERRRVIIKKFHCQWGTFYNTRMDS